MDQWCWNPITVCGMSHPQDSFTCVGSRKDKAACGNRVSQQDRKSAYHLLELLAVRPKDLGTLRQKLEKIATLRLCRRRHRDQKAVITEQWYEAACRIDAEGQLPSARAHNGLPTGETQNPIDFTSMPRTTVYSESTLTEPRVITAESLLENHVPFEVSPAQPARVTFSATGNSVTIYSISRGYDVSRSYCNICRETSTSETVLLKCEECHSGIHLGCTEDWLTHRNPLSDYVCPICRDERRFNVFFSATARTNSWRPTGTRRFRSPSLLQAENDVSNDGTAMVWSQGFARSVTADAPLPATSDRPSNALSAVPQSLGSIPSESDFTPQQQPRRRSARQRRAPSYYT